MRWCTISSPTFVICLLYYSAAIKGLVAAINDIAKLLALLLQEFSHSQCMALLAVHTCWQYLDGWMITEVTVEGQFIYNCLQIQLGHQEFD